ncbi:pilus assembly protein TadG-related protein [Aeromicrobium sp. UC242_57]|uniref:pilus assembly protein TadG-related protein n=1 Tax=Aeromicrobium sp. UC242_57 TaxID=3374624 RepID=UPI0037877AB1
MTVFLVVVVLTFTAFAVDLGIKRVARSDMQAVADVVALDMARKINGRSRAVIEADPAWLVARDRSIARNKTTVGSTPVVQLVLGKVDPITGAFSAVSTGQNPTAVKATATSSVDFAFVSGSGTAARSAIATVDPGVCFSVGSFLASLDTNESALNSILGGIISADLRVLSPAGVATVRGIEVPLLGIATELGVGTADALLALPQLTVARFITAMAAVLTRQGNTAQANFLNAIALRVPTANLNLADILSIAPGNNSALNLNVSVLELLGASLFVANGTHAIAIPDLGLNLGLLNVAAKATIIAPPKTACGD